MRRRARHRPEGQDIARTCLEYRLTVGPLWSIPMEYTSVESGPFQACRLCRHIDRTWAAIGGLMWRRHKPYKLPRRDAQSRRAMYDNVWPYSRSTNFPALGRHQQ